MQLSVVADQICPFVLQELANLQELVLWGNVLTHMVYHEMSVATRVKMKKYDESHGKPMIKIGQREVSDRLVNHLLYPRCHRLFEYYSF